MSQLLLDHYIKKLSKTIEHAKSHLSKDEYTELRELLGKFKYNSILSLQDIKEVTDHQNEIGRYAQHG